jgi:WD40 repeat protein
MGCDAAVSFVCFTGEDVASDAPHVVTGGFNQIMFWTFKDGNVTSKKGVYGTEGSIQPLTCGAMMAKGRCVTGTVGGSLFEWDVATGTVVKKVIAHTGCVTSVSGVKSGGVLSSGKDGFVKMWTSE